MSVPAPSYGPFGSRLKPLVHRPLTHSPLRSGVGVVSFALGMLAAFGTVAYAAWLVVGAVNAIGNAAPNASGTAARSLHQSAPPPAAAAPPGPTTPADATLPFDHLWVAGDGNTIVVGAPMVGISALTGESMIQVPVTLTNNGERPWNLGFTSFTGTLNHAPVAESTDGDWMYRVPIVPHTSITLNKIFVGHPGQFTLKISTDSDKAIFSGRI
ncbi:MAG TPA: hypothetical protein VFO16_22925 [Pseudonocardiaceae bacterium]|nr:hypothetical protein [Pseudonocardiaceae bacterium]